jgi:EAL domain-containing protein (putative c-di-GMP-specific phosphodiesterase class I)
MYKAKEKGRDAVQFFLPEMQEAALRRLQLMKELRAAVRAGELSLHYQPQTDVEGRLMGLEALLRWEHAERGFISPAEFVPVAEESGLIFELHDWVLERVCADIRHLQDTVGVESCPVISMNVSPREFRRPSLVTSLESVLGSSGIEPRLLKLEITEGAAMENVEQVILKMEAVCRLGVSFSIDDFGTGYSSLAYLKRLPVDSLKIDRSFVRDILDDSNDRVLVTTVISMARQLGLRTVAEGVEDAWTRDFLDAHGCDLYQGWLYGRPQPLADILPMVQAGRVSFT